MVGEGKETGNKNETINLPCSLLETGHKFCFYSEQFQFFADFSSLSRHCVLIIDGRVHTGWWEQMTFMAELLYWIKGAQ